MEGEGHAELLQIAAALHDLCQPLTALVCRLEIGQMQQEYGAATVLAECLQECGRLSVAVATMRELVRQAQARERYKDQSDWIAQGEKV